MYLDQEKFLEKVLKRSSVKNCKSLATPDCKCHSLSKNMYTKDKKEISEMLKISYT